MMTKREAVRAILDGTGSDYIPVIMNIVSFSAARYGYEMPEILMSAEKYCECVMGTQQELGYDGFCGGLCVFQEMEVAGQLLSYETGQPSGDGQDTIHSLEDLDKLAPFDAKKSMALNAVLANIKIMRETHPEEPIYVIMYPPTGMAFDLMGARFAFKNMVKKPELFKAIAQRCEDIQYQLSLALWEAGVDFIWYPEPNFGGACISRKTYERCVSESNIRFFNKLRDAGVRFVIHTCGPYNDRFDLVYKEGGHAWHLSDTETKPVVDEWGGKMSFMGNLPCVACLLNMNEDEVYQRAYNDCMLAGGRLILSGDCDLAPATKDENIRACVRAARDAEKVLFA